MAWRVEVEGPGGSILGVPVRCPAGQRVGLLELDPTWSLEASRSEVGGPAQFFSGNSLSLRLRASQVTHDDVCGR